MKQIINGVERSVVTADNLSDFKASDIDDTSNPSFYGFLNKGGSYYILRMDSSANTFRYFRDSSNYEGGWVDRKNKSYQIYSIVF